MCLLGHISGQTHHAAPQVLHDPRADTTLQYFLRMNGVDGKYQLIGEQAFDRMEDSLFVSYEKVVLKRLRYYVTGKVKPTKSNSCPYLYTTSYANWNTGVHDAVKPVYFYAASVTRGEGGKREVAIRSLQTIKGADPFPKDSIGKYHPADLTKVDSYVAGVGFYPASELAQKLTKPFHTELEKVRAIYRWITLNISYDHEGLSNNTYVAEPEQVLKKKATTCAGYTKLFGDLCSFANIQCVNIFGWAYVDKTWKNPHEWNAVQIDGKWYLVDATWGRTSEKYFLPPPEQFIRDHFCTERKWNLLPDPPLSRDVLDFAIAAAI